MRASLELHTEWNCAVAFSDLCWEKQGDAFQSSANKGILAATAVVKKDGKPLLMMSKILILL